MIQLTTSAGTDNTRHRHRAFGAPCLNKGFAHLALIDFADAGLVDGGDYLEFEQHRLFGE